MAGHGKYTKPERERIKRARKQNTHKKGTLTDQQRFMLDEYFRNGFRKVRAAKAAGYSTPGVQATRVFSYPWVQAEIERRFKKMEIKDRANREAILEEYGKIGFARLGELMAVNEDGSVTLELQDMNDDDRAALSEFVVEEVMVGRGEGALPVRKTRIKFHDKRAALDSMSRVLGLFNDKVQVGAEESLVAALLAGRKRVATKGEE